MESVGEAETGEGEAEQRGEQELTGTRTRSRDTVSETQSATAAITSLHRNNSIRYRWYSARQTLVFLSYILYAKPMMLNCKQNSNRRCQRYLFLDFHDTRC